MLVSCLREGFGSGGFRGLGVTEYLFRGRLGVHEVWAYILHFPVPCKPSALNTLNPKPLNPKPYKTLNKL